MNDDESWQTPQFGQFRISSMPFSTYGGSDPVRLLPDGPVTAKVLRLRAARDEELRELAKPRRRLKVVSSEGKIYWLDT